MLAFGYSEPSLRPRRLVAGGLGLVAVLQPSPALGRQFAKSSTIVQFKLVGAQHFAPPSIGSLVEEGIRAAV